MDIIKACDNCHTSYMNIPELKQDVMEWKFCPICGKPLKIFYENVDKP